MTLIPVPFPLLFNRTPIMRFYREEIIQELKKRPHDMRTDLIKKPEKQEKSKKKR
jgi:hypothetical protein